MADYSPIPRDFFWREHIRGLSAEKQQDIAFRLISRRKNLPWHVEQLLDMGVPLETEGYHNNGSGARQSLLHEAVDCQKYEIAEMLLKRGAPVNILNEVCALPLVKAVENDDPAMVRLLLRYGADPADSSDEWGSALEVARGCCVSQPHSQEILALLQEAALRPPASPPTKPPAP